VVRVGFSDNYLQGGSGGFVRHWHWQGGFNDFRMQRRRVCSQRE
jgi:hypothetical protein